MSTEMAKYTPPSGNTLNQLLPTSDNPALITFSAAQESPPQISSTISYNLLRDAILRFSPTLLHIPVQTVIAIVMPNGFPFITTFFSITSISRVAAPLNPSYTVEEFQFYLEDAGVKAVVVKTDTAKDAPIRMACSMLKVPIIEFPLNLQETEPPNISELPNLPTPDSIALFLHTSGTTSRPKGVPLSHGNLMSSVRNIALTYRLATADRNLLVMPLFHVHGLLAALLTPLATHGSVLIPPEGRFSARYFWPCFEKGGANWYTAVPTIHQILLARADDDCPKPRPNLRFIRSCSASLAPIVLERMEKKFETVVLEAYAMSEAAHQMTSNPLPQSGPRKPGSVGLPQGSVSVSIRDNDGLELKSGTVGEICVKGENVFNGYTNKSANETAFFGEWLRTGDQGTLDEEGYLNITGRIKELVNRGGEKISPAEVDSELLAHPAIEQAVCFGVPDEKYGEEINAGVILRSGTHADSAEITSFLKGRIAAFKVPKRIFFCDVFPKTATGKIQRRIVAKHFAEKSQVAKGQMKDS